MAFSSLSSARFTSGQVDALFRPRLPNSKPPVVYIHTAADDASEAVGSNGFTAIPAILGPIADAGYSIVAPTQPVASFGNDTAQGRVPPALAYARANLGSTNAPAVFIGSSQGSAAALRFAALNPTLVACVITTLTVCDLTYIYDNDLGGNRALVGAAYGVTYPTPLPANSDPATMTANLVGIPMMLHHSSDDQFAVGLPPSNHPWPIETFCSASGATAINVGALGHTNASMAATDVKAVLNFILANT